MKEQLLSDGDRAALQGLVPLAGAIGAGTIFALFGARERRANLAVFEIFAAAAILACVATTAYFAVALLHLDEAIGVRELTWTATPLLIAILLLIVLAAFDRLPGGRLLALAPLALAALVIALCLSSLTWEAEPGDAPLVAGEVIAVGLLLGLAGWAIDRRATSASGRSAQKRLADLAGLGYEPAQAQLLLALPGTELEALAGWRRKGCFHLDVPGAERLERLVRERWGGGEAEAISPLGGGPILFAVTAPTAGRYLRGRRDLSIVVFDPGKGGIQPPRSFERSEQALFDVTAIVDAAGLG